MRSLLTAVRDNASAVQKRLVPLLQGQPRLAYVGGHGVHNLGDDALFEAAQQVLDGYHVATFRCPPQERRLARLGLSGARYFQQFILGGGTFIN
ncbi:MAG TPA: hypothetical protein VEU33_30030, partial [Archangium sp.]|nr:hypothetical protein [Archangium sp.]